MAVLYSDRIPDNVKFAFPHCFDTGIPERPIIYSFEWEFKILVYHFADGNSYQARVFYRVPESKEPRWKPWMDGGDQPDPKEALESLLRVSGGVLEYLRNQNKLPDWKTGEKRKIILDEGSFLEKPTND